MKLPEKHLQTVAVPYGWVDGQLFLGIVTAYRSRTWTLPKASIAADADAGEAASNEALRQGGFLGLSSENPLLTTVTSKGVEIAYYPVEITGVMDAWDANRTQSRKLVPAARIEKFLQDRVALRAIRLLVEQRAEVKLLESPKKGAE